MKTALDENRLDENRLDENELYVQYIIHSILILKELNVNVFYIGKNLEDFLKFYQVLETFKHWKLLNINF